MDPLVLPLTQIMRIVFGLKKHDSTKNLREKLHILTVKLLHLKEILILKLLVKILRPESHLKELNSMITPAGIELLSKMRKTATPNKPSDKNTANADKSKSVLVRKFLIAMLKLEPNYAQHITETEKSIKKCFLFSSVRIYKQGNADLHSFFY